MRFLALASVVLISLGIGVAQTPPATAPARSSLPPVSKDVVFIVAMTPESVVDGVETEVAVTVAYDLTSRPEALVELAANTLRPDSFFTFTSQRVVQGSGTVTVRGKLTPRFWTANIVPRVKALLVVPGEELTQRKAIATDGKAILVALRPNPAETYAVNPNPSVVHEDGVRIKSITPQGFVEGQPAEIEVRVTYDLRSRDTAELMLNFSRGMANSYSSVAKTEVSAGQGEVVLHGRVVPKRTGNLPFAKVLVNLSETPRRPRSISLASDDETVEVQADPTGSTPTR